LRLWGTSLRIENKTTCSFGRVVFEEKIRAAYSLEGVILVSPLNYSGFFKYTF